MCQHVYVLVCTCNPCYFPKFEISDHLAIIERTTVRPSPAPGFPWIWGGACCSRALCELETWIHLTWVTVDKFTKHLQLKLMFNVLLERGHVALRITWSPGELARSACSYWMFYALLRCSKVSAQLLLWFLLQKEAKCYIMCEWGY